MGQVIGCEARNTFRGHTVTQYEIPRNHHCGTGQEARTSQYYGLILGPRAHFPSIRVSQAN